LLDESTFNDAVCKCLLEYVIYLWYSLIRGIKETKYKIVKKTKE